MPQVRRAIAGLLVLWWTVEARGQGLGEAARKEQKGLSLIYTGRSLGALGALRSQDEHELLTERANQQRIPFKLVSHACWRAPGLAISGSGFPKPGRRRPW